MLPDWMLTVCVALPSAVVVTIEPFSAVKSGTLVCRVLVALLSESSYRIGGGQIKGTVPDE